MRQKVFQPLFCIYFKTLRFLRKIDISLQPDRSLKTTSHLRFTVEVFFVNAHIKSQFIAQNRKNIYLFSGDIIGNKAKLCNLSQYGVLVALYTVRHKIGCPPD